jgi:hypothetical protein
LIATVSPVISSPAELQNPHEFWNKDNAGIERTWRHHKRPIPFHG